MFRRFWERKDTHDQYLEANDRIISIHIPKTAGTSFRMLLTEVYGEDAVLRVDYPLLNAKLRINGKPAVGGVIQSGIVHGHFNLNELKRVIDPGEPKHLITWLRDPVERVISNYYYLRERLVEELQEEKKNLNILNKMMRSLMEYAAQEINQNIQYKFLEGTELNSFSFIGITERFDQDIKELGEILGWPHIDLKRVNLTKCKEEVSAEDRRIIAKWNDKDMKLYHRVLESRDI